MSDSRLKRTISSALWAAYGDALGFPTELASDRTVQQRIGQPRVSRTEPWKRVVGGRFGAQVSLPAGAYSDDTQLRLATSRAITGYGSFDVDAFSKVELPIWQSYALGAGRGSKAAASALSNRSNNWFSNFFLNYENGGGNGAAMRIQPHVWAARNFSKEKYVPDVIRNTLCTHGHMRAIAGAVVHAVSLAYTFEKGRVPSSDEWICFAQDILDIPKWIANDGDLATFWLPMWERKSGCSLDEAASEASDEWIRSVNTARNVLQELGRTDPESAYYKIVSLENGLSREERGSGLKCALFANVAAYLGRSTGAQAAIEVVANLLDSDTDTIASMAGALIGAANPEAGFLGVIQDEDYICQNAARLYDISQGVAVPNFDYPDILYWQAPRTVIDALTLDEQGLRLEGLGRVVKISEACYGRQKNTAWCWFRLSFGQSILVRHRADLLSAPKAAGLPGDKGIPDLFDSSSVGDAGKYFNTLEKETLPSDSGSTGEASHLQSDWLTPEAVLSSDIDEKYNIRSCVSAVDLDELTNEAIRSFDPAVIGRHLLTLAEQSNSISLAIAYASIVVKARSARLKHRSRKRNESE